jgi:hypothetical protein
MQLAQPKRFAHLVTSLSCLTNKWVIDFGNLLSFGDVLEKTSKATQNTVSSMIFRNSGAISSALPPRSGNGGRGSLGSPLPLPGAAVAGTGIFVGSVVAAIIAAVIVPAMYFPIVEAFRSFYSPKPRQVLTIWFIEV